MFKKLRRFIVKNTLEEALLQQLRELNLLGDEDAKLIPFDESKYWISFNLKTKDNSFQEIYFTDFGKDKMTVSAILKDTYGYYETIKFSVSKLLCLKPKTYTIKPRYHDDLDALQNIDIPSGKITLSMCITEAEDENLEKTLTNLMKKTSAELFIRNIKKVSIVASDFGEKIYWIDYELSKPVYKPNSSIDLKQFYNLRDIF